jgi:hypothetical protein
MMVVPLILPMLAVRPVAKRKPAAYGLRAWVPIPQTGDLRLLKIVPDLGATHAYSTGAIALFFF